MLLVRKLNTYQRRQEGIVLTIGNFDGIHKGHRAVLAKMLQTGKGQHLQTAVMCFEPQPLEYFAKEKSPARLSRFRDKFTAFASLGVDVLFCLNFNKVLATTPAQQFITDILIAKLNVKQLIVGDDFHFGANGQGNFALLQEYGRQYGFTVSSLTSFMQGENRVSSTEIRRYLREDRLAEITGLLGEPFYICGKVSYGRQLGRTIDYPTANINLLRRVVPLQGVYAVKVYFTDGSEHLGIANVGTRPTVNGIEPKLEVHIFEFTGTLYHQSIKVSFIKKIRNEIKFASLAELKTQISKDVLCAQHIFMQSAKR